jgi:hypothetical protein
MMIDVEQTLDDLFLDHIEMVASRQHSWGEDLLHVSDLCSCPRMVGMRLLGEEPRPMTKPERRNKAYTYYLANHLHDMQYAAWAQAGILVEKECSIRGYLPEGWTGRFDAIIDYKGGPRITDVKTVKYLAKTGSYPYLSHIAQVCMYHYYIWKDWGLTEDPILYYIQRDLGHSDAVEASVALTEGTQSFFLSEVKRMEDMRAALPDLPLILPRELKFTGKRAKGKYEEISSVLNQKCTTKWCDYAGHTCEPDAGSDVVATRRGDDYVLTDFGSEFYADGVADFLNGVMMDEL